MSKMTGPVDEIDLGNLLLKVNTLIKKNFKYIIIFISIGLVGGVIHFSTKRPVYKSNMILNIGILDFPVGSNLVDELNNLIFDKNYKILAEKLSIANDDAKKIRGIEVENANKIEEGRANNEKIEALLITVRLIDMKILNSLEKGLVNYLENNPYIRKRIEIDKENFNSQIAYLESEIEKINTLKEKVNQGQVLENERSDLLLLDPANLYRQAFELFNQKLKLQKELKLIDNFQIIQGFTPYQKPVSFKLTGSLIIGFFVGLILSFVFIFFRELSNYTKRMSDREQI